MLPTSTTIDILKLAGRYWMNLDDDYKDAWRQRADRVNKLPIIGSFPSLPSSVNDTEILKSLNMEFKNMLSMGRNAISSKPRVEYSNKTKQFGKEKVVLGSQLFRKFFITHLMQLSLFGKNNSFFDPLEVVHRSKITIVVHIKSRERMKMIFNKFDACVFEIEKEEKGMIHTCAGKVNLKNKATNKEGIGYILNEASREEVSVVMEGVECDTVIAINNLKLPLYDHEKGVYDYGDTGNDEYILILEYNPLRLKISTSGHCQITLNKILLSFETHNLIPF